MLVTTRFRVPPERVAAFRPVLEQVCALMAARPGCQVAEVGRNVDDPTWWVLHSRWDGAGAYRRALGAAEVKMLLMSVQGDVVDEPSAYEVVTPGAGLNESRPRSLP